MYIKFGDKISSQQVDHSCLPPSHDPTEPVLTGNGCVIVLKGGQGGRSVCVCRLLCIPPPVHLFVIWGECGGHGGPETQRDRGLL